MMERLHFFSTRRTRERTKEAAFEAKIADFQTAQLAMRVADEEAAARSPAEKSEAQSRSPAERRKSTPAV
jgi:hypothetical protein